MDWAYRWGVIAAAAAVAAIGLSAIRVRIDEQFLLGSVEVLLILVAIGLAFAALASRIRSLEFVLSSCANFFYSVAQFIAASAVGMLLAYVAASANFPLMDDSFARLDAAMGFQWADANEWVQRHQLLQSILWFAYGSSWMQLIGLFLIHCAREPRQGSGELIWIHVVSLLIVTTISMFLPAVAMPGMIGQHHTDVFLAARDGGIVVLDESKLAGIIAFPSYHAAMGVICIYSARKMKWLLAALAPLNLLLIAATPTCGGHYLVDTIAGVAVAVVAIRVVRTVRGAIVGQASKMAARHYVETLPSR